MMRVNIVSILIVCAVLFPANAFKPANFRVGVGSRNFLKLSAESTQRSSSPQTFDPLNLGSNSMKTESSSSSSIAAATSVMSILLFPTQEAFAKGRIAMKKISGHYNPADILTKPKERTELGRLLGYVGAKNVTA